MLRLEVRTSLARVTAKLVVKETYCRNSRWSLCSSLSHVLFCLSGRPEPEHHCDVSNCLSRAASLAILFPLLIHHSVLSTVKTPEVDGIIQDVFRGFRGYVRW